MISRNNIPSPVSYSLFVLVHTPIHHTLPKFTPLPITFPLVWIFMTQLPFSSPSPHSYKSLPASFPRLCSVPGRILSIVLYVFSSVRDRTSEDVHGPWRRPGSGPGHARLRVNTNGIRWANGRCFLTTPESFPRLWSPARTKSNRASVLWRIENNLHASIMRDPIFWLNDPIPDSFSTK